MLNERIETVEQAAAFLGAVADAHGALVIVKTASAHAAERAAGLGGANADYHAGNAEQLSADAETAAQTEERLREVVELLRGLR